LSDAEYDALRDQHCYYSFAEELRMLEKVREFYRRYPEAEGRIRTHVTRIMESKDPRVVEKLWAHVPFDQIELPPEQLPVPPEVAAANAEVVEYLKHNDFALGPRLSFVSERAARLKGSVDRVACPSCAVGRLQLDPEHWVDPNDIG
jgi:hypothetical protein